jgi:hypothetical protein
MKNAEKLQAKVTKHKSSIREKQQRQDSPDQTDDHEDVIALKTRISQLEAENKGLRERIAALSSSANRQPVQSYRGSVREQQHNFFKYSNIRRY